MLSGRKIVSKLFGRYLLPTNIVSGIGLAALGDYAKQKIVIYQSSSGAVDQSQSLKMGIASIPLSCAMHFWYKMLDNRFPGKLKTTIAKKVCLDLCVMGPTNTLTLVCVLSLLERKSWDEFWIRFKHSIGPLFLFDLLFYTPVQIANFYFFPTKYRTIVVYSASVVYYCVASFVIHEFSSLFKKKQQDCELTVKNL